MTGESDGSRRRSVVVGALAGLVGLSGCTSIGDQSAASDDESTPESAGGDAAASEPESATGASESAEGPSFYASDERSPLGVDLTGNPIEGARDAPVTMYYWSDFQCPFCKRFQENAYQKLARNEIRSGTVRVVYLEFPAIGQASKTAALLQKCVWRQVRDSNPDAYGRWHEAIYDEQEEENTGWASRSNVLSYTRQVDGVDADRADRCLTSKTGQMRELVGDDERAASEHGVNVTPTLVLHSPETDSSTKLSGAQPYERYAAAIEKLR